MINWLKTVALICCLFNGGVVIFLVSRFGRIVAYYEMLDPKCSNVKLFFISGMEYGAGLVVIFFLFLLCLKVFLGKKKPKTMATNGKNK
jgi:hypothetical protein